jgi:hypothetical protein
MSSEKMVFVALSVMGFAEEEASSRRAPIWRARSCTCQRHGRHGPDQSQLTFWKLMICITGGLTFSTIHIGVDRIMLRNQGHCLFK